MENLARVSRDRRVTLPLSVRKRLRIANGDLVAVAIEEGRVVLTPKKVIDSSQEYFWNPAWQAAEREASEDIAAGRTKTFDTVDALFVDLDSSED